MNLWEKIMCFFGFCHVILVKDLNPAPLSISQQAIYNTTTLFNVCPQIKPEIVNVFEDRKVEDDILQGSVYQNGYKKYTDDYGFVTTVIHAYNNHHNIVIRPDDVWLAIVQQFSFYINANSEKYRKKFVAFEGKKELIVRAAGTLRNAPYDQMIAMFTESIEQNIVDPKLREFIIPTFSTSTKEDEIVSGVMLMGTLKKYFNFKFMLTCGIPNVTLLGTLEDWKNIYGRLDKLLEYDLNVWVDLLKPVISKFVEAKEGRVDQIFWQRICDYQPVGSGSPMISGWITVFNVFNEDGRWLTNSLFASSEESSFSWKKEWLILGEDEIVSQRVSVNVTVDEFGTEYKTELVAGHFGFKILPDNTTIQPKSGWYIALKSDKVHIPDY